MRQEYNKMLPRPLMECGCVADSHISMNGKVYHFCFTHLTADIKEEIPNLSNRIARCDYCQKEVQSDSSLPVFRYEPNYSEDRYDCGCRGY